MVFENAINRDHKLISQICIRFSCYTLTALIIENKSIINIFFNGKYMNYILIPPILQPQSCLSCKPLRCFSGPQEDLNNIHHRRASFPSNSGRLGATLDPLMPMLWFLCMLLADHYGFLNESRVISIK